MKSIRFAIWIALFMLPIGTLASPTIDPTSDLAEAEKVRDIVILFPHLSFSSVKESEDEKFRDAISSPDLVIRSRRVQDISDLLGAISSKGTHCSSEDEKALGFLVINFADDHTQVFSIAPLHLVSRNHVKCFAPTPWLTKVVSMWDG